MHIYTHIHLPSILSVPQRKPHTTRSPKWCTMETGLSFSVEFSFQNKIDSKKGGWDMWNYELSANKF